MNTKGSVFDISFFWLTLTVVEAEGAALSYTGHFTHEWYSINLIPMAQSAHRGVLVLCAHGWLYLELLHGGHLVGEHAVPQHGDGVALAAHLLDLLTCAVATGSDIKAVRRAISQDNTGAPSCSAEP